MVMVMYFYKVKLVLTQVQLIIYFSENVKICGPEKLKCIAELTGKETSFLSLCANLAFTLICHAAMLVLINKILFLKTTKIVLSSYSSYVKFGLPLD